MSRRGTRQPKSKSKHARPRPAQTKQEQDHQVLNDKRPPQVQSIADALVIKDEDVFLVTDRDGRMPLEGTHGFGLYYHDCRFLNGYELRLAGQLPNSLVANPRHGSTAQLELTNPGFEGLDGHHVRKEDLGIHWERTINAQQQALYDRLVFQNFSQQEMSFPIQLAFQTEFEPIFVVRGMTGKHLGKREPIEWHRGTLVFRYAGSDGLYRGVQIHFSLRPEKRGHGRAEFRLTLPARGKQEFEIIIVLHESPHREDVDPKSLSQTKVQTLQKQLDDSSDHWMATRTRVQSDSLFLQQVLERSLRDLRVLRSHLQEEEFFSAGVPWYVALFGRDSLIGAFQTLAYEPHVAAQTLRLLARYQGCKHDDWRAERPGKILHELRVGELARKGAIPQTPYYGSIDSTPLFLILLGEHALWTGGLELFRELRDNIERALAWVDQKESEGGGYLQYENKSDKGLANQGWKDSGDSIVNADGSLAEPPIKLVEVQGYVYLARLRMAYLFDRAGDTECAKQLRQQAQDLKERFNRDFWLSDRSYFALALQAGNRPCAVIASNPGQALWSGIVAEDKARAVAEHLLADDMFNGWGVRTLSTKERRYNPIGYHDGTVWPHDNAFLVAGLRRYQRDAEACRIVGGIIDAALHFGAYRLPEVFAGFDRLSFGTPVHYPVACHPQAWAAGSVPFMLTSLLGLEPEGFDQRLRIVRPVLPDHVRHIELHGLRVGRASVDLRFERQSNGSVGVQVLRPAANLEVKVETTP